MGGRAGRGVDFLSLSLAFCLRTVTDGARLEDSEFEGEFEGGLENVHVGICI
jgi:hypothetical protein